MHETAIRGPILNPGDDGRVAYLPDGVIEGDARGTITFVGPYEQFAASHPQAPAPRRAEGIICPPFLDAHIHIPQHPIRGRFLEGVAPDPPEGRLIAGLNRNVFPAEARCVEVDHARAVIEQFLADTLASGVVGGAAYMTVHHPATRLGLELLPETWSVGLVLMNQNCPQNLRVDDPNIERHLNELAERFGRRLIITDRFAVAVDSSLRRRGAAIARRFNLMTQTHLNEQISEKALVEEKLYPDADSYTDVYARDGLLDVPCILAHCVHMHDRELDLVRDRGAVIAHCPTSNTLLGSGVMPLDRVREHGIEYAICTDVGASPTTSLLAEMAQFLRVHHGRTSRATPSESLYRATVAPARILGLERRMGTFEVGRDMSLVEVATSSSVVGVDDPDDVILKGLLGMSQANLSKLDGSAEEDVRAGAQHVETKVLRVTLAGKTVWQRA